MVSYLARVFGLGRLELAEDVVMDTLCRALELWPMHGVPENPSAWLMRVARNRAIDLVRRDDQFRLFAPELIHLLRLREELPAAAPAFDQEIEDDQLRMMFACCHPELSTAAQVTLILKTLCGFSVAEIAHALLAGQDTIEKRLGRARQFFRAAGTAVAIPEATEIPARLDVIHQAIYLLFNEGYHGSRPDRMVRQELCCEAIRLALLLDDHPLARTPGTHALLALLCFHAARLPGRIDEQGGLIQLALQDRTRWDRELIARGFHFLTLAATGSELSEYHLQAAIAAQHCAAATWESTDWGKIVEIYDLLYQLTPTSIVALNRAIALGHARGPEIGLAELGRIADAARLKDYPFLPAALAEFHLLAGRPAQAAPHFAAALDLARSRAERDFFTAKLDACRRPTDPGGGPPAAPRAAAAEPRPPMAAATATAAPPAARASLSAARARRARGGRTSPADRR